MIFGFNTDVKLDDTVFHVQSEARKNDLLLQTQVFVRGRCMGKIATSYAASLALPDFAEQQMHEMLKDQHRRVLEAVRAGQAEALFQSAPEIQDWGGSGLAVNWVNSDAAVAEAGMVMRFVVTDAGSAVEGAQVISRAGSGAEAEMLSESVTDGQGIAELRITLAPDPQAEPAVLVQAKHGEKSATRKFRLKR